ncbi:retropepsin-like aspartic protease family protein [Richelia sinica]|uniref:retropepsin-like aspartic protease family protein n=1 Tax=Richelia sinica TaxID=1357545 RepID=UPI0016878A3F|nr:retropepsin-like aspartic protease [Richelia sinica]MBD2665135.1 retroviral-like aspartic protease family protein [Richelia sinica FACHB-800]
MRTLESRWIAVVFGWLLVSVPSVATANDPGLCFMVTSSGKTVSLGQLCKVTTPTDTVIRVPIKRRQAKTPIIDVRFNGNQVYEMVFDTGASGILITQTMATALKVKPEGTMKATIADGSIVEFSTGMIASVAVGSAVVNNPRVTIAPRANIGLLGHGFFENYDVQILDNYIELRQR